jgi:predicted metalloprotease
MNDITCVGLDVHKATVCGAIAESGHHAQNVLGILPKAQQAQRAADSKAGARHIKIQVELQADCLAGLWANRENEISGAKGNRAPATIHSGRQTVRKRYLTRVDEAIRCKEHVHSLRQMGLIGGAFLTPAKLVAP